MSLWIGIFGTEHVKCQISSYDLTGDIGGLKVMLAATQLLPRVTFWHSGHLDFMKSKYFSQNVKDNMVAVPRGRRIRLGI